MIRLRLQFCLAVAACLLFAGVMSSAADDRPNVLLILSDDHSVPHVGCYPAGGNCRRFDLTPHLNALAAGGMRFDRWMIGEGDYLPLPSHLLGYDNKKDP